MLCIKACCSPWLYHVKVNILLHSSKTNLENVITTKDWLVFEDVWIMLAGEIQCVLGTRRHSETNCVSNPFLMSQMCFNHWEPRFFLFHAGYVKSFCGVMFFKGSSKIIYMCWLILPYVLVACFKSILNPKDRLWKARKKNPVFAINWIPPQIFGVQEFFDSICMASPKVPRCPSNSFLLRTRTVQSLSGLHADPTLQRGLARRLAQINSC
jgi:hypothetical protein